MAVAAIFFILISSTTNWHFLSDRLPVKTTLGMPGAVLVEIA